MAFPAFTRAALLTTDILISNTRVVDAIGHTFMRIAAAETEIRRTWVANWPTAMTITGLGYRDAFAALNAAEAIE